MYNPPANRVDVETGLDLVERSGFGQLISVGSDGLQATGLPLLLDRSAMTLRGHFARANLHWADLDGVEIAIDRIDGKRKVSQNRSDTDRRGVIDAHAASGQPTSTALAAAMRSTDGWDTRPGG